jgi:aminomethyltransferase
MADAVERSPLDALHRELGARMVPFGGWDMPLEYDTGTLAEHLACRNEAVVFDVSHLGTVQVSGADALAMLQGALSNDLGKIAPGRAQYSHLLDEADASVLDDIIVWWHPAAGDGAPDVFDVMPNASNTDRVRDAIGGRETTHERAVLAVQGPQAIERLATVFPDAAAVGRFRVGHATWQGAPCTIAGTGYTGERGVEIAVPADAAAGLWAAIVGAGIRPAGLGARDTLRLEVGLPLHGHELGPGITPLQAGLGWVVAWTKPTFRGKTALAAERDAGIARHLVGIATEGRRPPRAECAVLLDGASVGVVTSGNFSPVLGHGIALALVPPSVEVGAAVAIDVRGTALPGTVVDTPFVPKH